MSLGQGGAIIPAAGDNPAAQPTSTAAPNIQQIQSLLAGTGAGQGAGGWTPQAGGALSQISSGAGYGSALAGVPYDVWNQASLILGYDARRAFTDYVRSADPAGIEFGGKMDPATGLSYSTNEATTFLEGLLGAAQKTPQTWVLQRAREYWTQTYGGELPAAVASKITAAVASGGVTMKDILGKSALSTTSTGALPSFIKDIVDTSAALDPSTRQSAVDREKAAVAQSRLKSYIDTFGRAPTLSQTDLAAMDNNTWNDYLNNQQYKSGMTLGQYNDARTLLDNAGWQHWFGKAPSDADVKWAMAKAPEDITARIDQSSYDRIPGMKIGEYKGFATVSDKVSKSIYGYSTPDHLVKAMWDSGIRPPGMAAPATPQ